MLSAEAVEDRREEGGEDGICWLEPGVKYIDARGRRDDDAVNGSPSADGGRAIRLPRGVTGGREREEESETVELLNS